MRVCSVSGCPALYDGKHSRCPKHRADADRARGTSAERGYTSRGHKAFRAAVLARDPICVICNTALATVADHYPISRRDLVEFGMNPNDPDRGRGTCFVCHSRETAKHQPGGWHATQ
jgi:5-methylcytosine-specific restriction protein A